MDYEFRRAGFLDAVMARLAENPVLLLTGPRGAGKTRALKEIRDRWQGAGPRALIQLEPIACTPEVLDAELSRLGEPVLGASPGAERSFASLLSKLPRRRADSLLLLDDVTEIRTLSYYPSVQEPLPKFLGALSGPGKVVLTSRFSYWMKQHFEALPSLGLPPLSASELADAGVSDPGAAARATGGLAGHAARLAETMAQKSVSLEDALEHELTAGGRIEAECRATLSELVHRARGYGACKSVLRVLAEEENLKLSEVARRLDRTAGSTRDYLRWLEEVDLIVTRQKRFSYVDPLLRVWMRIYGRGEIPGRNEVRREIETYLRSFDADPLPPPEEEFTLPATTRDDLVEID